MDPGTQSACPAASCSSHSAPVRSLPALRNGCFPRLAHADVDTAPCGALATSRLAHKAQRLPLLDGETDVLHGVDRADLPLDQNPGGYGEALDQVTDLKQGSTSSGTPFPQPDLSICPRRNHLALPRALIVPTCVQVCDRLQGQQRRHFQPALLCSVGAPRMKTASRRTINKIWRETGYVGQLLSTLLVQTGDRSEQSLSVGMLRIQEELIRIRLLNYLPRIHDDYLITYSRHHT